MPGVMLLRECMMNRALKSFCLVLFIGVAFQPLHAQTRCDRLSEIRIMPFKDERVNDAAYYSLIEAGESALPCLITKVTDTGKMRDPRQAPGYAGVETKVGDVAYFMVVRIGKFDFIEMFPVRVRDS